MIASSGAGAVEHFSEVFQKTDASAALAAGIFHRKEVISSKRLLDKLGIQILVVDDGYLGCRCPSSL